MESEKQLEILVLRSQLGEQEAFETLFRMYQPRLRYYLRRIDSTGSHVEDVLQEIWLKVYRKITRLKEPAAFTVWLYRIARNEILEKFRKKNPFVPLPEELDCPETEEPDFSRQQIEQMHLALEKIRPHFREVLTLFYMEQMSYRQIAAVISCNEGTIRSRLHYGRAALRKEMEIDHEYSR